MGSPPRIYRRVDTILQTKSLLKLIFFKLLLRKSKKIYSLLK